MHDIARQEARRTARTMFRALLCAALLVVAAFGSVEAGSNQLADAKVDPRTGTTATTITFEVRFQGKHKPDWVRVKVGATTYAMNPKDSGKWKSGAWFRFSGTMPAGSHAVVFQAKGASDLGAGTITIGSAATPKPTPKPTPQPTPRATAAPTAKPTPTPTVVTAVLPSPTASPTPPPNVLVPPTPSPTPSDEPAIPVVPAFVTPPSARSTGSSGASGPIGRGGPFGDFGPGASLASALGLTGSPFPPLPLLPTLITTSGGVAMAMAFSIFGRPRREDDPPSDELAADAALGVGVPPSSRDLPAVAAEILDEEAGMPRWRRPSLLQARAADPLRSVAVAPPRMSFDGGFVGPIAGSERRFIRYRVVSLLDAPDELRGAIIGVLDEGDEVQLLERRGAYWLVDCPDGSRGWLHKMTLGDVVEPGSASRGATATLPAAADSWTLGDGEDQALLTTYLAARRLD